MLWIHCQETVEEGSTAADLILHAGKMRETATMTMTVKESAFVVRTTAPIMEEGGMQRMTAVRGGAPLTTPAGRGRVTVSRTLTVSTLAGRGVAMTCVSTPSISPQPSTPTTQQALGSQTMTTAATESATRTTTGVGTMLLAARKMQTVMMVTTVTQTWTSQPAMS